MWRQILFRIIGVACIYGGLFAFYDFGKELLPLFEQFLKRTHDTFQAFTVLSSFFLGALSLTWIGVRMVALRSFRVGWYYCAMFPITVWLQGLYDIGLIATMDRMLSLSIAYLAVFWMLIGIVHFIHIRWYTPLSHESMRYVTLEKAETSVLFELRWVILCMGLVALLILHPADIGTTIDMVFSSFVYAFNFFR